MSSEGVPSHRDPGQEADGLRDLALFFRRASAWEESLREGALPTLTKALGADLALLLQREDGRSMHCMASAPGDGPGALLTWFEYDETRLQAWNDYRGAPGANRLLLAWGAESVAVAPVHATGLEGVLIVAWKNRKAIEDADRALVREAAAYLGTQAARHRGQDRLRLTEARLASIVETMPQGVIFADFSSDRAWLNQPAARLLDLPSGDCPVAEVAEAMRGLRRSALVVADGPLAEDPAEGAEETGAGEKHSRVVQVTTRDLVVESRPGRMWLLEEITEEHQRRTSTELALRDSQHRWQFALEGAGDGVWDWECASGRVALSGQWRRLLGFEQDEGPMRVEDWLQLIHPEDEGRVLEALQSHLSGRTPVFAQECRMRCKDGSYKWILGRGRVILRKRDGSPVRMIGTSADLSMLKRAEAERETLRAQFLQAQKMESIGRLAGGIAHDFNNLLTVINGYSAMLADWLPDGEPGHHQAREILAAGERAAALVSRLLTFSRRQEAYFEPANMTQVVEGMRKTALRLVGEDITIETLLEASVPPILADRTQLEQIVMNLVVNARDAMPEGGTLQVATGAGAIVGECAICHTVHPPGRYVYLSVRDSGTGIDEAVRPQLFEPFVTTKQAGKGTGLGLAVVHGIVTASQGHVVVESQTGVGTEFRVYFPVMSETGDEGSSGAAGPA